MKVQTKCPQCDDQFITEVPEELETFDVTCPSCEKFFRIRRGCEAELGDVDCVWEEHGEPRKTVLSSLKPFTNRPRIASFLLLTTFILGVFTGVIVYTTDITRLIFIGQGLQILVDTFTLFGLFSMVLIFSLFAFIGFLLAWKRIHYRVAFICAVLGIVSIGFFLGSILSFLALILIIIAREEFENGHQGRIF